MSTEEKPKEEDKEAPKKPKSLNNINDLTTIAQAEQVILDLDSPRFKQAMDNLQYTKEDFDKKKNFRENPDDDKDVIKLRKKHYYSRLLNTINETLNERRRIKLGRVRPNIRSSSPAKKLSPNQLTMYRTYFKSQKHINSTMPKNKSKRRVELALQDEENYLYKSARHEMKMEEKAKSRDEYFKQRSDSLKMKNYERAQKAKQCYEMAEQAKKSELSNYEKRLKEKDLKKKEHEENVEAKKLELKRREEEHALKQEKLMNKIKEIDDKHVQDGLHMLKKIEAKFTQSEENKLRELKNRVNEVHEKNHLSQKRLENYYRLETKRNQDKEAKMLAQRLKIEKVVEKHAQKMQDHQNKVKEMNMAKSMTSLQNRKTEDNLFVTEKLNQIKKKLKQNEQTIQKFQDQKDHEFSLKREQRKLKEEDFQRLKERQKRVEFLRKLTILEKEKEHDQYIQKNRSQLESYTKKRLEKSVKHNIEKESLVNTMMEIKSKALSPQRREQIIKDKAMNVQIKSTPKIKKTEGEEETR